MKMPCRISDEAVYNCWDDDVNDRRMRELDEERLWEERAARELEKKLMVEVVPEIDRALSRAWMNLAERDAERMFFEEIDRAVERRSKE